jgi:signal peptidase I
VAESSRWNKRDSLTIAMTIALVLVARSSFADHYTVPSGSMMPSVEVGDRVVVNKSAYGLRLPLTRVRLTSAEMPKRGDVVVLESPENDIVLLKRVVAVAGDVVSVRSGRVFLDGEPGDTVHPIDIGRGGPSFGPTRVPEGKLLVMGDNRDNSHDGRSFGFVAKRAVLGRAVGVYFRNGELRWIDL